MGGVKRGEGAGQTPSASYCLIVRLVIHEQQLRMFSICRPRASGRRSGELSADVHIYEATSSKQTNNTGGRFQAASSVTR